jgi:hypothetical protein
VLRDPCRRLSRLLRAVGLSLVMMLAVVACEAWATVDPSLTVRYVTREPATDAYGFAVDRAVITATAHSSTSGNSRAILHREVDAVSQDHQVCATWSAADQEQQPGLSLRVRHDDGATQAVTVTKNIWYRGFAGFNVHLMDTRWPHRYEIIGGEELLGLRRPDGTNANHVKPYPWRACARTAGPTVELKVWPVAETEPAWGDPDHGYRVAVPAAWDTPGRPGLYVGHLGPGGRLDVSDVVASVP